MFEVLPALSVPTTLYPFVAVDRITVGSAKLVGTIDAVLDAEPSMAVRMASCSWVSSSYGWSNANSRNCPKCWVTESGL